jgi:hypothetical protein
MMAAAIQGNAAFLFPPTLMVPFMGRPPLITYCDKINLFSIVGIITKMTVPYTSLNKPGKHYFLQSRMRQPLTLFAQ